MKKQILNLMAALAAVGLIAYTGCGANPDDPNAPQTTPEGDTNESLENPTEGGDVAPDPEKDK